MPTATRTFTATGITIGTPYGGGEVAYILQPGDLLYVAGQTHGLIAALADQSTSTVWAIPANQSNLVGGTGAAIGTGLANTNAIVAQNGAGNTYAAGLADAYTNTDTGTGVYSDWYLPSTDELYKLYINQGALVGSWSGSYWTSSEVSASTAEGKYFGSISDFHDVKSRLAAVRAVRSF